MINQKVFFWGFSPSFKALREARILNFDEFSSIGGDSI